MFGKRQGAPILIAFAVGMLGSFVTLGVLSPRRAALGHGKNDKAMSLDELTVKRLNVVDENGKVRLVLSNADRFPNPVLKGREFPRSIKPAGLVFYKGDGDEAGGIALVDVSGVTKNFLAFDYSNSEAIGMGIFEKHGGGFEAGLTLLDRQPLDADIMKVGSTGTQRIGLSNDDGNASIVLRDAEGKERIRLSVDKEGNARFEIKDPDGTVRFHAPP